MPLREGGVLRRRRRHDRRRLQPHPQRAGAPLGAPRGDPGPRREADRERRERLRHRRAGDPRRRAEADARRRQRRPRRRLREDAGRRGKDGRQARRQGPRLLLASRRAPREGLRLPAPVRRGDEGLHGRLGRLRGRPHRHRRRRVRERPEEPVRADAEERGDPRGGDEDRGDQPLRRRGPAPEDVRRLADLRRLGRDAPRDGGRSREARRREGRLREARRLGPGDRSAEEGGARCPSPEGGPRGDAQGLRPCGALPRLGQRRRGPRLLQRHGGDRGRGDRQGRVREGRPLLARGEGARRGGVRHQHLGRPHREGTPDRRDRHCDGRMVRLAAPR